QRFIEKPPPDQVKSHWINAGIYILESEVLKHVPVSSHYMFEKGLFPLLLELGEPVYGYSFDGYWLDMGTPEKYLCLNHDLLRSKAKSVLAGVLSKHEVSCGRKTVVHPTARIIGPAVIADGCRIDQGAQLIGPVVMASDGHIGENASIGGTVLWRGVRIGDGAVLKQCIIGSNTTIKNNARVINRVVVE
ncbi:MAG: NDP-sugar synthase, partial [Dehalococcoidales bacterium]|nr:NDP-sugar synthase [Dehalococcoidales bacterium]